MCRDPLRRRVERAACSPFVSNHLTPDKEAQRKCPGKGWSTALIPRVAEALRVSKNAAFLVDLSGLAHKGSSQWRIEIVFEAIG